MTQGNYSITVNIGPKIELDKQSVFRALQRATEYVKGYVVRETPVRTGRGRAAWTSSVDIISWYGHISNNVPYMAMVNEGTGLYGPKHASYMILPRYKKALAWPGEGVPTTVAGLGRGPQGTALRKGAGNPYQGFIVRKWARHPGIKGRHFVEAGIKKSLPSVQNAFVSELRVH